VMCDIVPVDHEHASRDHRAVRKRCGMGPFFSWLQM
jgi:hypothetical protein